MGLITLTDKEIEEVIDYLQGSCASIEEALIAVTDGRVEVLDELANERELYDCIDRAHFMCAQCDWWCEVGDYAEVQENPNGDICTDCGPEEE